MYLEKGMLLNTNVYDMVFYWIAHLIKNILYLKRCEYVFRILVVHKTYVILRPTGIVNSLSDLYILQMVEALLISDLYITCIYI